MGMSLCLGFLPLVEIPFFSRTAGDEALNHEQVTYKSRTSHELVTYKSPPILITSVKVVTPLTSPHEQEPSREC